MVKFLFKKFDKVMSLGSNCYVKLFLQFQKNNEETNFFDNLGTSMWAVNELIDNGFADLFNKSDYENIQVLNTGNEKYIYTNKKYYLIVKHDFKQKFLESSIFDVTNEQFLEFQRKYERRIKRFNEILNSDKNILFLRFHESKDKIIHAEYVEKYKKSELEYLFEFDEMMSKKFPKLKYKVIFISKDLENMYHKDKNIIVLKDYLNINFWVKSPVQIDKLINDNKDFLLECINN